MQINILTLEIKCTIQQYEKKSIISLYAIINNDVQSPPIYNMYNNIAMIRI